MQANVSRVLATLKNSYSSLRGREVGGMACKGQALGGNGSTTENDEALTSSDEPSTSEDDLTELELKIVSPTHGIIGVQVTRDETGKVLKEKALQSFCATGSFIFQSIEPGKDAAIIDSFKLIRGKERSSVIDAKTVRDLGIKNREELLLVVKYESFADPMTTANLAPPCIHQILEKTANVPKSPPNPPIFDVGSLLLEDDMRKVFVTLAQESAYVLGLSPNSNKLIAYYRHRMRNYIKNHEKAEKVMADLGFPATSVKRAMNLKANNSSAALDWLIDNVAPGKADELIYDRRSSVGSARRDSILSTSFMLPLNASDRIDGLLEIVKFYAEKDELVYESNMQQMALLGYEVETSREALRITRNSVPAAIAHIHGDENASITELRDGLALTSSLRQKFLASAQIQQAISNPENFAFFVGILDIPKLAESWNPFTDTGALMTHIIVTYHEDKHASAMNQFNNSRLPISALSAPT